jgi:hypothetical protein
MKPLTFAAGLSVVALILAGCATVTSKHRGSGEVISAPLCPAVVQGDTCVDRVAQVGGEGVAYFLPRQLVRVTATRSGGSLDDAVKAVIKAQSELEAAKADVDAVAAAVRGTQQLIIYSSGGDPAKPILAARVASEEADLATAKEEVKTKTAARDKAKGDLLLAAAAAGKGALVLKAQYDLKLAKDDVTAKETVVAQATQALGAATPETRQGLTANLAKAAGELATSKTDAEAKEKALAAAKAELHAAALAAGMTDDEIAGPGAYKVSLKMELLAPSADPRQAFLLNPRHTPFRDDEHKVTVSSVGLLTSTDITATDRTGDVLIELAAFSGAITGNAIPAGLRSPRATDKKQDCTNSLGEYAGVVDFVDPKAVAALNYDLQCLGVRVIPEGTYWPAETRPIAQPNTFYVGAIEGIVYRSPIDVQVRVEKCANKAGACQDNAGWFTAEVVALSLPQAGPISFVRQDAGFLTKTRYTLAFKDGILVDDYGSRPSELLEAARLPMKIIQAGFDGVSKVISLRTGQNTNQAALVASQLALLNAQASLKAGQVTGQKTVTDAELALLQSQFALQAGAITGKTSLTAADLALLQSQFALQAGAITGKTSLTAADLALLQSQFALQAGAITGKTSLTTADLALLQQQFALQAAGAAGQTQLTNADLARLQAQTGFAVAQNSAAAQLSASNLGLTVSLLRDQAKRDAMNKCIADKLGAGQPIDGCLIGL